MAPTLAMAIVGPEPARLVGRAAPLAFAAAGLLVLLVSAGFVRLSSEFAHAGSVYGFVGGAVGPRAGAFTGWTMLGTYLVFPWVSVAGVTVFGEELLRLAGWHFGWYVVALGGWLLVGLLGAGGLRPAVRALIGFEIAAVLLILGLMVAIVVATRHVVRYSARRCWRCRMGCRPAPWCWRRPRPSWRTAASRPPAP
jgi:amino acid transporter